MVFIMRFYSTLRHEGGSAPSPRLGPCIAVLWQLPLPIEETTSRAVAVLGTLYSREGINRWRAKALCCTTSSPATLPHTPWDAIEKVSSLTAGHLDWFRSICAAHSSRDYDPVAL
jgi:hypothetical protein